VAQRDAAAQLARVEQWLGVGLNVLNVAGFFVPALGELLLVIGGAQIVDEFSKACMPPTRAMRTPPSVICSVCWKTSRCSPHWALPVISPNLAARTTGPGSARARHRSYGLGS
jgi:hypothetical protein